jgi:hypothetical protein
MHGYEPGSLGYVLKYDDRESLIFLSMNPEFNFLAKIYLSDCDLAFGKKLKRPSLIAISAFYGSVRCFKFLLLNGYQMRPSICKNSIRGGNTEIISLCEQEHGDFSKCLPISVQFLRNEIADSLLTVNPVFRFSFNDCIPSMNVQGLCFLLENGFDDPNYPGLFFTISLSWKTECYILKFMRFKDFSLN